MLIEATNFLFDLFNDEFVSVYNADGGYVWNNKNVEYPSVCFDITSIQTETDTITYNFTVTAACRQREDIDSTSQANYNYMFATLERCFNAVEDPTEFYGCVFSVGKSRNYQFAPLKLMDVCAVCTVSIAVTEYIGEC